VSGECTNHSSGRGRVLGRRLTAYRLRHPRGQIGRRTVGCGSETVVLHDHVTEQITERPPLTRSGSGQIGRCHRADDDNTLLHGTAVETDQLVRSINTHPPTIC